MDWKINDSGAGGSLNSIIFANGKFWGISKQNLVAESSDGVRWELHPTGVAGGFSDIAYGNGRFIAVGAPGTFFTSTLATSPDGREWRLIGGGVLEFSSVTFENGVFVTLDQSDQATVTPNGFDVLANNKISVTGGSAKIAAGNGMFLLPRK